MQAWAGSSVAADDAARAVQGRRVGVVARWLPTLKARLAVGSTLVLFATIVLTLAQMLRVAEEHTEAAVEQQQQFEVQHNADIVGRRVRSMQLALSATAPLLSPELVADTRRLREFLLSQASLRASFVAVVVADGEGRVVLAATRDGVAVPQADVARTATFERARRLRRPVISSPTLGVVSGRPVVVLAHPLIDAEDRVYGVLFGSLALMEGGLAADLADSEGSNTEDGEVTVVTDAEGRIVSHPDPAFVLRPASAEPRLAPAHARWVEAGRPLSAQAGTWSDEAGVVAMAGEPETGWQVWRILPRAQLQAPLRDARAEAFRVGMLFSLAMALLLVWFLSLQLRPLERLQRRAAQLLAGDQRAAWPEADGEIGRLAATLRQVVAERMRAEEARAVVLRRLGSVLEASPVGLMFERDGRLELVSAEVCRLLGRDESRLIGASTEILFAVPAEDRTMRQEAAAAFAAGGVYEGEWRLFGADGLLFWSRLRARPVDAADPRAGTIWCMYDISGQVDARQQLEHAARHDPLTGLLNRDGLAKAVQQVLAARAQAGADARPATLVMIDLDRFKPVNDLAGHAAGDTMLRRVAAAILESVRSSDSAARIGGDEFALLLPHCDGRQGQAVAAKVGRAICALQLVHDGQPLQVGASLGVAELCAGSSADQWLAAADAACYDAKRAGGGVAMA